MKCKWIAENGVFDEDIKPLIDEIKLQGMEVKEVGLDYYYGDKKYEDIYPANECVITYGSLQLCNRLAKMNWYPSVWCSLEKYRCVNYYAYWGNYLLNKEYIMLPFRELERRKEELFKLFGQDNTLFIRPDNGFKSFTGNIIYKENFNESLILIKASINSSLEFNDPNSELIVIAPPKNILKEWRFIVAGDEVITGSQYRQNGVLNIKEGYPQEAFDLAKEIINSTNWQPDPMFSMDICQTEEGFNLLEIGAFSSSGMYRAEFSKVVKKASELALKEWQDVN